jgi:tetratricopeptide (TPR) repeat protein
VRRHARSHLAPRLPLALVLIAVAVILALPASARRVQESPQTQREFDPVQRDLGIARQALLLGDTEEAIRIYEEILAAYPDDLHAFWGLAKAYEAAGLDREKLIPLLEGKIETAPGDYETIRWLGEAYARLGENERAHEIWQGVLRGRKPDPDRYAEIGALEMRNAMFEEAVGVYLEGRGLFGRPGLYGEELVQAYTYLGEHDKALAECVLVVGERPGRIQWATNRVELMLEQGASKRNIERTIRDVAESADAIPPELAFAGSVFVVLEEPKQALEAFIRADDIGGAEGRELLSFAIILRDDGRPEEAIEAFRMVVDRHGNTQNAAVAAMEAARLLAELDDPEGAVGQLKRAADTYIDLREGAEALLMAAKIEVHELRDPGAALATLAGLSEGVRQHARGLNQEGALVEIDAYLMLGRLDDAYARTELLLDERTKDDVREQAMYKRGYVSFLKLDSEKSLGEFREMVRANAQGELVNDALRLMLVIADSQESGNYEPLNLFAAAHRAKLMGDVLSAEEDLEELIESHPGTPASIEGLMLLAAVAEEVEDFDHALEVYYRVIEATDAVRVNAEARMRRGDILRDELGRNFEAMAEYLAILDQLPPNYLSGEARRKIDQLRRGGELEG